MAPFEASELLRPGVLLVTGAYYPEISSAGQQCRAVVRFLGERVRFLILTTAVDVTLSPEADVDGVKVYRLPIDVANAKSRVAAAFRLARVMVGARRRFEVVHIHGVSSKNLLVTVLARVLRKRIVLTLHTAGQDEPDAVRARGRSSLRAFQSADVVLSVSPVLSERYRQAGLPLDKLRQTINGIDTGRFHPASDSERAALRHRLGLPEGRTILFVGFFSRDKRPDILFDAWTALAPSAIEPLALVYVGATASPYFEVDPELAPRMRRQAERLGVAHLLHFVEFTNEIEQYYRAADVFALPSVREALPMALLEAMSSGLPSVASRLSGATDVIIDDGTNGLLVTAGDAPALGAALHSILNDRTRAAALGAAARATIESRYSLEHAARDWVAAYDHVLAGV